MEFEKEDLNLKLIPFYKNRYGCLVGYSGHEQNIEPSVVAASLGAEYIERHITTDHNMWGTDQKASLEISAMDMLKRRIDDAILAMGNGIKTITPSEMGVIKKLRG
jgi:N-acetylneuraminate synthase